MPPEHPTVSAEADPSRPSAVYVHIPFCARRCLYCDFNTYDDRAHEIPRYMEALVHQISTCPHAGTPVTTIYVGGGTPSLLPPRQLQRLFDTIRCTFRVDAQAEISVEVNPASADCECFATLRSCGVTRLSVGVQSLDDAVLRTLGRLHSASDARMALRLVQAIGFSSVSADIMFGIPGQTMDSLQATVSTLVTLGIPHISAYALSIEDDTPFARMLRDGRLTPVTEETAAEMYAFFVDYLSSQGYEHYEVSNFARPGHRCRHNLVYWRNKPYLGFGAGAASYVAGVRSVAVGDPRVFAERIFAGESVVASSESLSPAQSLAETVMLSLRMAEGVDLRALSLRYAAELVARLEECIPALEKRGLVRFEDRRIRLTRQGLFLADSVIAEIMAALY